MQKEIFKVGYQKPKSSPFMYCSLAVKKNKTRKGSPLKGTEPGPLPPQTLCLPTDYTDRLQLLPAGRWQKILLFHSLHVIFYLFLLACYSLTSSIPQEISTVVSEFKRTNKCSDSLSALAVITECTPHRRNTCKYWQNAH